MGDYADDAIDQGSNEWLDEGCPGEGEEESAREMKDQEENDGGFSW